MRNTGTGWLRYGPGNGNKEGKIDRGTVLAALSTVFTFIAMVSVFYFLFINGNPPAEIQGPIVIDGDGFEPGGEVPVSVGCIGRNVAWPSTVFITYESPQSLYNTIPPRNSAGHSPHACAPRSFTITLPVDITPGEGYFRRTVVVFHGPIVDRQWEWVTPPFDVLPLQEKTPG